MRKRVRFAERRSNIHVIRVLERERRENTTESIFENKMKSFQK